jgi:ribulose-5-phosphate 4-epimerase/fuculose-1-phosphate aldolase
MKDKAHFLQRVSREMQEDLQPLALPVPEALAASCRILAAEGHESGLAGQVTARGEKPGTWWTLQFGYGFEEATKKRMVLVDEDLSRFRAEGRIPACAFTSGSIASARTCKPSCIHTLRTLQRWPPRVLL